MEIFVHIFLRGLYLEEQGGGGHLALGCRQVGIEGSNPRTFHLEVKLLEYPVLDSTSTTITIIIISQLRITKRQFVTETVITTQNRPD